MWLDEKPVGVSDVDKFEGVRVATIAAEVWP